MTGDLEELARRIDAGGDDGDLAAVALGLLLKGTHVDLEELDVFNIRTIVGRPIEPMLSRRAAREARAVLRCRIQRDDVPSPAVVSALARSFDPEVITDLIAVMERTLEVTGAEETAHQAVRGIAISAADPRVFAALRLAAERGRGDAKRTAEQWLRTRGDEPPPEVVVRRAPVRRMRLEIDAYCMQMRPGHRQLVVNDGGRALLLVDPFADCAPIRISLSPAIAGQTVHNWLFRDDGAQALLVSASGAGSLVLLDDGAAVDVTLPEFATHVPTRRFDDVRYVWSPARLIVTAGTLRDPWKLVADPEPRFERMSSLHARRDEPAWTGMLDALEPANARVLRTYSDLHRVLAYDYNVPPGDIVAVDWIDARNTVRVPAPSYIPELTFDGVRFYLLYDREVHAIDRAGRLVEVYRAPDDTDLYAMEVVPAGNGHPPVLAVATEHELLLFELASPSAH